MPRRLVMVMVVMMVMVREWRGRMVMGWGLVQALALVLVARGMQVTGAELEMGLAAAVMALG